MNEMRAVLISIGFASLCLTLLVISALGVGLEMRFDEQYESIDAASMGVAEQKPIIDSLKLAVKEQRQMLAGTGLLITEVCYIRPGTPGYENVED